MIRKLLVANRAEIACRIIRSARSMGIRTAAVYSEADASALHTQLADEALLIGGAEPTESYLRPDAIIEAAQIAGADAIHPGYGFLSESADFSERCANEGITFVGPPAAAMRKLGNKIDAKKLAVEIGVPITPGYFEPAASHARLLDEARRIGFPVMLKAAAGGGGRGMRAVWEESNFLADCAIASAEALSGFGDDAMMVEKLIERPRHVEVQFLADQHGTIATLFERECSLQRRHQKLMEETPSPAVLQNPSLWPKLAESARSLAAASGYFGAGTCEFMVDDASGDFYFLEVNARLQVEHPVTEIVAGLDLVKLQISVAQGEKLDLSDGLLVGDRSHLRGHAIEARIVAEDPAAGFMPSIGKIIGWTEPNHPFVRVDTGYQRGSEVTRFYDSLLAKVIAFGSDRSDSLRLLRQALRDFHILGVKTNIGYLLDVLDSEKLIAGEIDTGFLNREFGEWRVSEELPLELETLISAAQSRSDAGASASQPLGAWDAGDRFRNARG